MTDRDRLIELIVNADTHDSYECKLCTKKDTSCTRCGAEKLTDYLLANGVKLSAELQNKCGSCVYAKPTVAFGKSKCYVTCTNREHIERFCKREISTLRQRTNPACKNYMEEEE